MVEFFLSVTIEPFQEIFRDPIFFLQVIIEGLMAGVMYSLVALGFVLIYKASGVFNFAQGIMVVFAVLCIVAVYSMLAGGEIFKIRIGIESSGMRIVLAIFILLGFSGLLWFGIKRVVLQPRTGNHKVTPFSISILGVLAVLIVLAGILIFDMVSGGDIYSLKIYISNIFFRITVSLLIALLIMTVLSVWVEKLVLRPLVNQEEITLFMATIGLAFFIEGFGETIFGGNIRIVPLEAFYIEKGPILFFNGGLRLQKLDLIAAVSAGTMVATLALFFRYTPVGRALRAVADDHQAAQSVGIPLGNIWIVVWMAAGVVAMLAGVMWGAGAGVSFGLAVIALKALPVLILGGFTSIPGVIIGGLIIGVSEKIAEIFWSDAIGGGIEDWFAYVLALGFLMFRPQGLFGEKIIERI